MGFVLYHGPAPWAWALWLTNIQKPANEVPSRTWAPEVGQALQSLLDASRMLRTEAGRGCPGHSRLLWQQVRGHGWKDCSQVWPGAPDSPGLQGWTAFGVTPYAPSAAWESAIKGEGTFAVSKSLYLETQASLSVWALREGPRGGRMRGCCRERQCMEKQTRARERGKTGGHFAIRTLCYFIKPSE